MKTRVKIIVSILLVTLAIVDVCAILRVTWQASVSLRIGELTPRSADISLRCLPWMIVSGTTTTITGQLHNATSDVGIPYQMMEISYRSSTGTSWTVITVVSTAYDGSFTHTWLGSSSLAAGAYVVRASFSGDSAFDPWSSQTDLRVVIVPPPPVLVSPGSNSSPGPGDDTLQPTFTWNRVPGADEYGLYIRDMESGVLVFDSQVRGRTITGTSYTLLPGVLQRGGRYRWNMNAHNEAGWGDYCSPLYFQTINRPPDTPEGLAQIAHGVSLAVGASTSFRSIEFHASVTDPDGDTVQLQVELRNLLECSGEFNETAGGLKVSALVASGSEVAAYANDLIDESYHWRARTIDEHGLVSSWVEFGDNNVTEADFTVNALPREQLIASLTDLKEAVKFKLAFDVDITAEAFTSVKDYWRADRWGDLAAAGLTAIKDGLSLALLPVRLFEFIGDPSSGYVAAKSGIELFSLWLMAQGIQQAGEDVYTCFYKPSYTNTIKDMLDAADECFFFNYDSDIYCEFINTYLSLRNQDSPLLIPRKSGDLSRETVEVVNGWLEMYVSISKKIRTLIADIADSELPEGFSTEAMTAQLVELKNGVLQSCYPNPTGGTTLNYDTYLMDGEDYVLTPSSITLGEPANRHQVFIWLAEHVADKAVVEMVYTAIKVVQIGFDVAAVHSLGSGPTYSVRSSKISQFGEVLRGASMGTQMYLMTEYSDAETQFYEQPQVMLLSLPMEFSNLWMLVDDLDRSIRHEIDLATGTSEDEIDTITVGLFSPGMLQVEDSEGRVTGIVDGVPAEEIPNSECFGKTVMIFSPNDTYCYRVVGTASGFYGIQVNRAAENTTLSFSAMNIPLVEAASHLFSIDWAALASEEDSVMVTVDSDGNGVCDYNLTSNSDLTRLEYVAATTQHDLSISGMTSTKSVVGEGYTFPVNITITNYGVSQETFTFMIYANTIPVHSQLLSLANASSVTINYMWNTTGVEYQNYTLSAVVDQVPGEVCSVDNTLVGSQVIVSIPGDIDGSREVDIFDIVKMATIYGIVKSDSSYDPNCDVDGDGDIDIFDIVAAASHYGESW